MNILVVDDNAASLYMLMVLLPAHGHSLETAANGMEALEKLNTKNFDLIVSDILMPKMDGFEFCRTVRAEPRWTNIPFIFYTATYTSEADERFALNVGADRFLIKPMAPDLLIQNIRDAYEQKKTAKPQSKPAAPEGGETFLREYNERLINKLEDKMLQVEREKERYRVTLSAISDGVIAVDAQHRVVHMNPAAEHLTGWIGAAAHGLSLEAVCPLLSEHAHEPFADPVARCIEDGRFVEPTESLVVRDRDGTDRAVDIVVSCSRDPRGEICGYILTLRDVTERRKLSRQISFQATHDALTGLFNRYEFERRLQLLLDRSAGEHALLYLDLDQFKVVNDTCGHGAGDELLRQLGHALRGRSRTRDTLARLGGDEFGMILEDCPSDQAVHVAEELRRVVQDFCFVWDQRTYQLGISIGVAPLPAAGATPAEALSAADSACYAAKSKGRNRLHLFHAEDSEMVQRLGEMQWLPRIQHALIDNRFLLYSQPITALQNGAAEMAFNEVLLRLIDENGNIVMPEVFIPAAERYNQAQAIDRWVVDHSVEFLRASNGDTPARLAINLSGQSIVSEEFLEGLSKRLEEDLSIAARLCFEITETAAIVDLSQAIRFVTRVKSLGSKVALDDFGSGLSSFSHLRRLPVDFLKIDGQFVRDMTREPADCAVVKALTQVGRSLGLQIIAEWAEDAPTVRKLRALNVDYAQGFAIAMPAPLEDRGKSHLSVQN